MVMSRASKRAYLVWVVVLARDMARETGDALHSVMADTFENCGSRNSVPGLIRR